MATYSSILAWRIPWTEEPGWLQSMGSQKDMTEQLTLSQVALEVKNLPAHARDAGDTGSIPGLEDPPWRRKWQPTPVFLPGKSHGERSLAGYSRWGHRESQTRLRTAQHDMEVLITTFSLRKWFVWVSDVSAKF